MARARAGNRRMLGRRKHPPRRLAIDGICRRCRWSHGGGCFRSAEHTRFSTCSGAMHLASRAVATLYESLRETCPDVPSRGYVESLDEAGRQATLHDVGHGPFGHFLRRAFSCAYRTESRNRSAARFIRRGVSPNCSAAFAAIRTTDWPTTKRSIPSKSSSSSPAREAARRRAAMAAVSAEPLRGLYHRRQHGFRAARRLHVGLQQPGRSTSPGCLHYSQFTDRGLTIHERGLSALGAFHLGCAPNVFPPSLLPPHRSGDDLELPRSFRDSKPICFPATRANISTTSTSA